MLPPAEKASIVTEIRNLMSLNSFVTHSELANFDYASCTFVLGSIPTIPTIPLRLDARLADLESAVSTPGVPFDQLKARFKDMEDRQIGKAVTMGGFTSRSFDQCGGR